MCMHTCILLPRQQLLSEVRAHTHTHTYTHSEACMCAYTHVCIYSGMHSHTHAFTHTNTNTHTDQTICYVESLLKAFLDCLNIFLYVNSCACYWSVFITLSQPRSLVDTKTTVHLGFDSQSHRGKKSECVITSDKLAVHHSTRTLSLQFFIDIMNVINVKHCLVVVIIQLFLFLLSLALTLLTGQFFLLFFFIVAFHSICQPHTFSSKFLNKKLLHPFKFRPLNSKIVAVL